MKKKFGHMFVLRYNQRDDDLGDQFIMKALADSLSGYGRLLIRKQCPDFLSGIPVDRNGLQSKLKRIVTNLGGSVVFDVLPPGAVLRKSASKEKNRVAGGARETLWNRLTKAKRISLGRSVIPDSDHSWCQQVDWIGLRDNASIAAIKGAGIQHVGYFPDLAFLVEMLPGLPRRGSLGKIGFSFRSEIPERKNDDVEYSDMVRQATACISQYLRSIEQGQVFAFHQVTEDASYTARLADENDFTLHQAPITLDSYQDFYQEFDVVFSNRLHCLLMGALRGAIPIAVTTQEHTKIVSLYETIGWENLLIFADKPDEIISRLEAVFTDADGIRGCVSKTMVEQNQKAQQAIKKLDA